MSSLSKKLGWDDLKLVMTVADAGNLAGAAAQLSVNASTIFRRLRQIEQELQSPLFERHRMRYDLTSTGMAIVELARRVNDDVNGVLESLSGEGSQPQGELRLTTNDTMLFHVLMPLLKAFRQRHPLIQAKVTLDNNALSLSTTDSDVALRATDHPPEHLAGRRVGRTDWALYGRSMDYQDTSAPSGADVFQCQWVTLCDDLASLAPARFVRKNVPEERIAFAVNSVLALADAMEAGLGIGYLPCFVGDARPALIRLDGPPVAFGHALWLLFHPHMRKSAVVREFIDFATHELQKLEAFQHSH